jgi:hypothetical protein
MTLGTKYKIHKDKLQRRNISHTAHIKMYVRKKKRNTKKYYMYVQNTMCK